MLISNPLPKAAEHRPLKPKGRQRQILAQPSGPTRTKCGRQKILIYEAVATQLPAVRLLTSLVLLTVCYGVPELCVMVVYVGLWYVYSSKGGDWY